MVTRIWDWETADLMPLVPIFDLMAFLLAASMAKTLIPRDSE